jgi:transposase
MRARRTHDVFPFDPSRGARRVGSAAGEEREIRPFPRGWPFRRHAPHPPIGARPGTQDALEPFDPADCGKHGQVLERVRQPARSRQLTAAKVHDSKLLEPLVDAVQPIRRPIGAPGRPRKRPAKLHADKGYDFGAARRAWRQRGIVPRIARRGVESSERLGRHRWVVERTQAWIVTFRKLAVRFDRHAASVLGLLHLACALICLRFLYQAETAH